MVRDNQSKADAAMSSVLAPISKSGRALQFGGSPAVEQRIGDSDSPHPNPLPRRGEVVLDAGRLSREGRARKNMCFCETNPPFFDGIFIVSDYEYVHCERN